MEKSKVALGVAVVALVLGGASFFKAPSVVTNTVDRVVEQVGGQTDSAHKWFMSGATLGGKYLSTTTGATLTTYTLQPNDLVNDTVLAINPTVELALKFGATSSSALVPNIGDTATVYLRNASTTAAATITVSAVDTSTDMQFAEATGGDLVLLGLDWAKVTFIRNALTGTSQVTVIFDEMTEAD